MKTILLTFFFLYSGSLFSQKKNVNSEFVLARLKYNGGGDWYNDPSAIPNLHRFLQKNTNIDAGTAESIVEISDDELFSFPVVFMTGHGKISFSKQEAERLRLYLDSGGFLFADDDYGMDKSFRNEIKKVFPGEKLVELPFTHKIFRSHFIFNSGAPKIHEHDGGPPKSFGIFREGRLVVFYTFNTNISDGWADETVHNDPPEVRLKAFEMGANIIVYALSN